MGPKTAAERIQSLDISLNGLAVGTLVRTPGDYNAFNLSASYRALDNPPVFSLSLRAAGGGLRNDPKPVRSALPHAFRFTIVSTHSGANGGFSPDRSISTGLPATTVDAVNSL